MKPGRAMAVDELVARECIRQTMVNYTIAGDRLRTDDFVAVFTDDAVLESEGVPESDAFRYEGRHAIREWMLRWRAAPSQGSDRRATFVRHHLSTSQVEFGGLDVASGRTYWVAYTDIGPDHCGYYIDVFRKTDQAWLIAHRKVRLDWRSPHSLFKTAIVSSR